MKKLISIFCFIITLSCSDNIPTNNCFRGVSINAILDLTLPEFQELNIPNGEGQTIIQGRNVYIFRVGNSYKAFDRQCPESNCNSLMTFDGVQIKCPCDDKKYNYLANGAPINNEGCHALMYFVTKISNTQLRISR